EALETIVYLYDVVGLKDKNDLMRFDSSGIVATGMFDETWQRLVLKMATHAGLISHDAAVAKAETELVKFRVAQAALPEPVDRHFEQALGELEKIEGEAKALPEPKPDEQKKRGRKKKP